MPDQKPDVDSETPTITNEPEAEPSRRGFLSHASGAAAVGGVALSYGAFAGIAARYLYPAKPQEVRRLFVAETASIGEGGSVAYRSPGGAHITVARQAAGDSADAFIALSTVCPHLGCNVHWEPQNDRFFCPCHNGVFTPDGVAVEGPPAEAGQALSRFPLHVDNGLLFIEVPIDDLTTELAQVDPNEGPAGPGHDPCLFPPPKREEIA